MQYDLIYPEEESLMECVPCVVAASYFDVEELISFGVPSWAFEVNDPFREDNEFEKVFKLWDSPLYLRNFFAENEIYFRHEYWGGITEDEFVEDVTRSLNDIRREFISLFGNNELHRVVEPLGPEDADARLYQSIRVKIKRGWVHRRLVFRFYAVEIEEKKCYLITGAAIKIHKDMLKAQNTAVEMAKLKFASEELASNGVNTKESFIDFVLSC